MTKIFRRCILFLCSLASAATLLAEPLTARKDLEFTEFFRRTNGLVAGDAGASVPLSDGAVLWLFGDSHISDFDPATGTIPCIFQVRNAALLQQANSPTQADTLISSNPTGSFLRMNAVEKTWFWPTTGFQTGGSLYIFAVRLQRAGHPGKFDFKTVNHYWAKMDRSDLVESTGGKSNSTSVTFSRLQDFKGIKFGLGFSSEPDGYTYAFGAKARKLASDMYIARFLTIRPEGRWTFWDGKRWTAAVTRASVIGHGVSDSMNVAKINGRWLAVSSAFSLAGDMGKAIYASTSTNLTGPFTAPKNVYEIEDRINGHVPFFYLPSVHPEFINASNEVLVTYSINGAEPAVPMCHDGRMNPDEYRLKAFRLPLETMGIR